MEDFLLPCGYTKSEEVCVHKKAAVFIKSSSQERCEHLEAALYEHTDEIFYIESVSDLKFTVKSPKGKHFTLSNRGKDDADMLVDEIESPVAVVDLTSLEVYEFPRLIEILKDKKLLRAIYIEPEFYIPSQDEEIENEFDIYQTSARISPIPGFSITRPDDDFIFIPFLGFQGSRLTYMQEQIQPLSYNTFPIIGFPGYHLEYPLISVAENASIFDNFDMSSNANYSPSNCPFQTYRLLKKLRLRSGKLMVVGILGTKPQCLGVIMYALKNPKSCEVIYDYPKVSNGKVKGFGYFYTYYLTEMWDMLDNVA